MRLFERLFTGSLAFGSQGAELGHVLLDGAADALLIEGQELEVFALGEPGAGSGQGFVDRKLGGVVAVVSDESSECAEMAKSEDAGFEGAGALEAPMVFGVGLSEIDLQRAYGVEGFADAGAVFVEGFVLVGGEKLDLAGEAVTIGVEPGAMLTFFGSS